MPKIMWVSVWATWTLLVWHVAIAYERAMRRQAKR